MSYCGDHTSERHSPSVDRSATVHGMFEGSRKGIQFNKAREVSLKVSLIFEKKSVFSEN